MNLTPEFADSYKTFESYPTQLVYSASYPSVLEGIKSRLKEAESNLLHQDDDKNNIPFFDFGPNGELPSKENILSDIALKERLGDLSTVDPQTSIVTGDLATKKDPKCRFIYFWASDSRSRLKLTRKTLARILTYHQVMPVYLDFLGVFGVQDRPRDLRFSGFREQTLLGTPPRGPVLPELGRSGRQFQLCYNLKAPFLKTSPNRVWSIRQAAIHHQFDVVEGTALWVVTKGDRDLKYRIEHMFGPKGRPEERSFGTMVDCFKSSLAVHLLLSNWSTEEWRWYIQSLEDTIDRSTYDAVNAPHGRGLPRRVFKPDDLLALQGHSDKVNEAIMMIESNVEVLTALREYYKSLIRHKDFTIKGSCEEEVHTFASQINDMIHDAKMQISRATLLVQITKDRKDIILQRLQTQTTEAMEDLAKSNMAESVAMRIITVVTLFYLPATFVSTFFSTGVVQYQYNNNNNNNNSNSSGPGSDQRNSTSFSLVALERWLEVTLPLTLITLVLAYYFFKRSVKTVRGMAEMAETLPRYMTSTKKT